jgi:hypothetical protein
MAKDPIDLFQTKKKLRNEQIHEQKKILVSLSHFNYLLNNILCTRNEMKSINV